jgi:glutamine---fructose-6-phosphate transaminase (isomerizing)
VQNSRALNSATRFERDILRQPMELEATLNLLTGALQAQLRDAANLVRQSKQVFLTGIGASWHAAMGAGALFSQQGRPVYMVEAADLLHFASIPPGALVIALSRTGRSIEVVQLVSKIRNAGARLIGITNSPDCPLAKESTVALVLPIALDHAISVNTYSTLAFAAAVLATCDNDDFQSICEAFLLTLTQLPDCIRTWSEAIVASDWLVPRAACYFLGRGPSLASAYESRLLWEEGAKTPATAMTTSAFRHGPQEIVTPGMRFCIWIDSLTMREQDLSVARDLRKLGASVSLVGQQLREGASDLAFAVPAVPSAWQFVVDVIPMQLAAEGLSRRSGVDCDSFRLCSYVVEDDDGLLGTNGNRKQTSH